MTDRQTDRHTDTDKYRQTGCSHSLPHRWRKESPWWRHLDLSFSTNVTQLLMTSLLKSPHWWRHFSSHHAHFFRFCYQISTFTKLDLVYKLSSLRLGLLLFLLMKKKDDYGDTTRRSGEDARRIRITLCLLVQHQSTLGPRGYLKRNAHFFF